MTSKDLAMIIGNIDEKYIAETVQEYTPGTSVRRRVLIAAVLAAALMVLSAAAFGADWFGVRSLILPGPDVESSQQQAEPDVITLAGYADTAEFKAAAEWKSFLSSYDVMEAAMAMGNGVFAPGTSYNFYQVYNQEMADKLDEITAKYGLKLHTLMIDDIYTGWALCDQVGGDFLGANKAYSTYMYEDGTFKFDGSVDLGDAGVFEYQFMRCVKGSFSDVMLNIGDAGQYTEWAYTTEEGTDLSLALGPYKALVIAGLEDSLVTINVLASTDEEGLEALAESFDFSVLSPARPADSDLKRPTLEEARAMNQ